MPIQDLQPPSTEPVSLEAAKTFLRLDDDYESELILDLIRAARERVERYLGVSIITRAVRITRALPRGRSLYLNHAPISEVTGVWICEGEETKAINLADLKINLRARPAIVTLRNGGYWAGRYARADAVQVDCITGYGETPDDIPMPLRQAILLLVAQSYAHREGESAYWPMMVEALLMPYRGMRL